MNMNEVLSNSELLKEKIKTWEDIDQYLLLDVNVSSEVPTTRVLEAVGSAQLYINRMLLHAEESTNDDEDLQAIKDTREISQQYRLWEANEKLAQYPSSYISPALRLGKTDIFESLEQNLGQSPIDEDMVHQMFSQYLTELQKLSELRVEGYTSQRSAASIEFCFTAKATWEQNLYYYSLSRFDHTSNRQ